MVRRRGDGSCTGIVTTMNPGEPLPVGHMLDGRYRIHRVLGQGGMGRVYLANDTRLASRPVAAKEMVLGDGIQERKAVEDFNREASVLATLSHPSIPQVIDYFAERGRHYLVMEYVAGGDLQHHLDQLGPKARLPESKVLMWARQILEVLHFLHSQKPPIVYRDLKPGNIMIDQHGRAMLVDFGIARFLPPGGRGTQIGSIGYAPPEQYLGKMEPRSDLYALAGTMHHLLTGRDPQLEPPFSFPPVRQLAAEVSLQTERVVMSALDKEIDKRPASAREMRDLLPLPETTAQSATSQPAPRSPHLPQSPVASATSKASTVVLNRVLPAPPPAKNIASGPPSSAKGLSRVSPSKVVPAAKSQRSPKPNSAAAPPQPVSSTSKTQDLGLKSGPSLTPTRSQPADQRTFPPKVDRRRKGVSASAKVAVALSSLRSAIAATPRPGDSVKTGSSVATVPAMPSRSATTDAAEKGRPAALGPARVPTTSATNKPVAAAEAAGAWLCASSDGLKFGIHGTRAVIGRADGIDDRVDIDLSRLKRGIERVSRRHAEIIKQGVDYFVRDLGSLNGTYIAGRGRLGRDQLYRLKDRDELVLGGAKLEFIKK